MTISTSQQIDYLWKKVGFEVAKTDTDSFKSAYNESIPSFPIIGSEDIWLNSEFIPNVTPTANTSQISLYNAPLGSTVQCVADSTAQVNRTWLARHPDGSQMIDWVPPVYGSTYQVKVYTAASGVGNILVSGTPIYPTGSNNDDEWFFDYQAGVLNFIGNNLPASVSGNVVYITGARYTGYKGIQQLNNVISNIGNLNFNNTTISTIYNTSGIILSAGNGIVQADGTSAFYIPAGTELQRPASPQAGYVRFNTDTAALEYFDGSGWLGYKSNIYTQTITPDGSTNIFTLDHTATTAGVIVSINGTLQQPNTAYTVTGNVLTLSEYPVTSDVIEIRTLSESAGLSVVERDVDLTMYRGTTNIGTAISKVDDLELLGNSSVAYTITAIDNVNQNIRNIEVALQAYNGSVSKVEYGEIVSNVSAGVATFTANILNNKISLWGAGDSANVTVGFLRKNVGSTTESGFARTGPAGQIGPNWSGGENTPITKRIIISNASPTTGANTGAIQAWGGMSISGNLYVGEQIFTSALSFAALNDTPIGNAVPSTGTFTTVSANELTVGNITPAANVTYNIGTPTLRFKDIWLSGTTIHLGDSTISTSGSTVEISNSSGGKLFLDGTGNVSLSSVSTQTQSGNVSATLSSSAQPYITSLGTLSGLTVAGTTQTSDLTVTGNITVSGSGSSAGNITVATLTANAITANTATISQNLLVQGNLTVIGNTSVINSADLSVTDSIIQLHNKADNSAWTLNDGKDIGIKMHYYDSADRHAFLGRANDTGYLEYYTAGLEGSGNVFTGTYGTVKAGEFFASNSTPSTNTTSGALVVTGGVGVGGNVTVGGNLRVTNTVGGIVSDNNLEIVAPNVKIISGVLVQGSVSATSVIDNNNRVVSTTSGGGNLTISNGDISLTQTGPGAQQVGGSKSIPIITTDIYGRVIGLSTASVSTQLNLTGDNGTGSVNLLSGTLSISGANGITTTISGNTATFGLNANSNGYGTRTVSSSTPSGGSNGDIWYQV